MRAAFYECDITPPIGGFMWGHYAPVFAPTVKDRLYAKAVVMEDGGEYAAIVVVDTCSLPKGIHKIVADRVTQYTDIPADKVCVSSNHSHSGAPVCGDDSVGCKADEPYLDVFLRLCADAIILAYQKLQNADVKYAISQVDSISFNRNFILEDGSYKTHGRGRTDIVQALDGIDPDLPVLMFESEGKPIGAIVNFACHQCCLSSYKNDGYSGDFSSYISKHLKEKYGHDFVSVFLLGACGDINHVNPDANVPIPVDHYQHMGKVLADSVIASMDSAVAVEGGLKMLMSSVTLKRRPVDKESVAKQVTKWLSSPKVSFMRPRNLIHYERTNGGVTEDTVPVQAIKVGDVLISIMPGEIYNAFGKFIKKNSGFSKNMVVENSNEYLGYIPTEKAFDEKNDLYETALCGHSCHTKEAGQTLADAVVDLAKKL